MKKCSIPLVALMFCAAFPVQSDQAGDPELGTLLVPVQGILAENLRNTFDEKRGSRRHDALDIMAPRGTPVLSATDGRVVQLLKNGTGGLMIFTTDTTERYLMLYAHLDDYAEGLRSGMPLVRGQVIGYVGTTGNAPRNAPHLHFAIKRTGGSLRWSKGTPVDPHPLLLLPPIEVSRHEDAEQPQQRAAGDYRDHAELETP